MLYSLLFSSLLAAPAFGELPSQQAPPPRAKPAAPRRLPNYYGEVLAVNKGSITIRGREEGTNDAVVTRTFPAGEALLRGEQDRRERSDNDYRLADVKVGDTVFVVLDLATPDDTCLTVRIRRRPGGSVPPAPWDNARDPHHLRMNAWQAFEEKGVPLPPKYDPKYVSADDLERERMLKEYRRQLKLMDEGRIAPPPRPVKPK